MFCNDDENEIACGLPNKYYPVVGLEIHAELNTSTKMFCNSKNDPDEKTPNVNICPVCMAEPGTLPVINKEAVKNIIKIGCAVGGEIANFTEFDRKNYFYPDIPKGYQISQYKYPIVSGGSIKGIKITRIHLEEDTAKSFHRENDGNSYVDFNRAGVPLMELVTEPVIKSAKEAGDFGRELQLILRYLGVSKANMEKGEMRVEANISVSADPNKFGTKVEVKNLNSFKAVEKAIDYEIKRHIELLEKGKGEEIIQETRGWDEFKQRTFSQRKKESSHDYRYFPDPDLPKLWINEVEDFKKIKESLPELPQQKRERFFSIFGLRNEAVEIFINEIELSSFFEDVVSSKIGDREFIILASNYITSDLLSLMKKSGVSDTDEINEINKNSIKINPEDFSSLIEMVVSGQLSSRGAKDTLAKMYEIGGGAPLKIATELGLIQKNDEDVLKKAILEVMNDNPSQVIEYKKGKEALLQFFLGQTMKKTKGAGNPKILIDLLKELLIK